MLALKKKREEQRKAAEEAAKAEAASPSVSAPANGEGGQVSLFGIGGQKKTKKGEQMGTKKTPGEIRIQKGGFIASCIPFVFYLVLDIEATRFDLTKTQFFPTLSYHPFNYNALSK